MSTSNAKSVEAVNRVSHERLEDLVREAITAKLNDPDCELRIDEYDLAIRKEVNQPVLLDLTVFGMAGNTTKDEFSKPGDGGGSEVVKVAAAYRSHWTTIPLSSSCFRRSST